MPVVDIFPVIPKLPLILAPVPVTTNIFALPAALRLMLPLTAGIFTLLVPFATVTVVRADAATIPVSKLPLPLKKFAAT